MFGNGSLIYQIQIVINYYIYMFSYRFKQVDTLSAFRKINISPSIDYIFQAGCTVHCVMGQNKDKFQLLCEILSSETSTVQKNF